MSPPGKNQQEGHHLLLKVRLFALKMHLQKCTLRLPKAQLLAMFTISRILDELNTPCAEKLLCLFNLTRMDILDYVAPFKLKRTEALSDLWLNVPTHALRRSRWRAERN